MGISVKIQEEVSAGVYRACGTYSDKFGNSGDADVLVEVKGRKANLVLKPELGANRIMGRIVVEYFEHPVVKSAKKIEAGVELVFENVPMHLKKI